VLPSGTLDPDDPGRIVLVGALPLLSVEDAAPRPRRTLLGPSTARRGTPLRVTARRSANPDHDGRTTVLGGALVDDSRVGVATTITVEAVLGRLLRVRHRSGDVDVAQRGRRRHGRKVLIHPGGGVGEGGPHPAPLLLDVALEQDDVLVELLAGALEPH
jgi:hypothetical protein